MNIELKKAIINFIIDNLKEFQIINVTVKEFKLYIYDDKGNYLIGGQEVYEFIKNAVKILNEKNELFI
jgi:hypothetical protein